MGVEAAGKPQTMTITDNDDSIIYPPPPKKKSWIGSIQKHIMVTTKEYNLCRNIQKLMKSNQELISPCGHQHN